jgi:YihY family inner membrane protein
MDLRRVVRAIDREQQRHPPVAFAYAVVKKFADDQGSNLAALITYYGFLSLFPLLLAATTVLSIVLKNDPALQSRILGSALAQFPVIGTQIQHNVHSLPRSGLGLAVGIAASVYGGLGVLRVTETAMNTVWNVPRKRWPSFVFSVLRALVMLAVLGVVTLAAALLSGLAGGSSASPGVRILVILGSLLLNLVVFLAVFRILPSLDLRWRDVLPGAVAAAAAWTALQSLGGYLVAHQLEGSSELYGFFGVVLAMLAWLFIGAQITLYAAEVNAVRVGRLWPRGMSQPPLTGADRRALHGYAKQEERRPEERVSVDFDERPHGT